ncbi:uncharacterized protein LOC132039131 [Lycium ferocissimum]|uniref:uncharacterized protein LOC132039131 n=1 Tax=Lycium ferocissimum TaxID=112874 RepID=UPI0028168EBF|nr:uncharacterized protein LOC132039131 [Lycium ferocissimum]
MQNSALRQNFGLKCQKKIQQSPHNVLLVDEEVKLMQECTKLKKAREEFLQQKCKVQWLKEGDQNTKFYHSFLRSRRNTNKIFTIKDKEGQYRTTMEDISKAFIEYYVELLGTANVERKHASSCLIRTGPILTEEQRRMLDRLYTDKDVKMALRAIDGNNAQDSDGYGSKFFKD